MIKKFRSSVTAKVGFVLLLVLLMLIPVGMITDMVYERSSRSETVKREITAKWGNDQKLVGPIVAIPWRGEGVSDKTYYLLPEVLNVKAEMRPEVRQRGIFSATVYDTVLEVGGEFGWGEIRENLTEAERAGLQWEEATLSLGLPDTRGIKEQVQMQWGGETKALKPGAAQPAVRGSGLHAVGLGLGLGPASAAQTFGVSIPLRGSESLWVAPTGKSNMIDLSGAWGTPSFDGIFLPEERTVDQEGGNFSARWQISSFGRGYPQLWSRPGEGKLDLSDRSQVNHLSPDKFGWRRTTANPNIDLSAIELGDAAVGVRLIQTVDFYTKVIRAVKYAVLFIGLTFLTFFLFETLMAGLRIHPIQYGLVGLAMSIFYLLLLSLSEYYGFQWAYIVSTFATVGLITLYSVAVLKARKRGLVMMGLLLALYAYLYVLLQKEEYALISGSFLLFGAVAVVMWVTRKIDWYSVAIDQGPKKG